MMEMRMQNSCYKKVQQSRVFGRFVIELSREEKQIVLRAHQQFTMSADRTTEAENLAFAEVARVIVNGAAKIVQEVGEVTE